MSDPATLEFRWLASSDPAAREPLARALSLREQVFCVEQGVAREEELDGRDGEADHLVALSGEGEVLGTLRLLLDGDSAKVGRVAVARAVRRRGIAARMLALALDRARRRGAARARLAAQTDAVALYQGAGFAIRSGVFVEAGIEHVWMERDL